MSGSGLDVLWVEPETGHVVAAFEVEYTTSIRSGILRMLDLALDLEQAGLSMFLVDEAGGRLRRLQLIGKTLDRLETERT